MIAWKFEKLYPADPAKVAAEIEAIGDSATPEQVLEKARSSDTELHKCFEWRDDVAAEKYRLVQARQVCNSLVFVKDNPPGKPPFQFRLFFNTDASNGYKATRLILQNPEQFDALLQTAIRELKALKDKYKMIQELRSVFEEIDKLPQ